MLNSFDNHDYPDKGVSKLCLLNELDESLLLIASSKPLTGSFFNLKAYAWMSYMWLILTVYSTDPNIDDGNVRIWKDYTSKGQQKLVTAFPSIQGHRPGVRSVNAVVDWQQQSGYLVYSLPVLE